MGMAGLILLILSCFIFDSRGKISGRQIMKLLICIFKGLALVAFLFLLLGAIFTCPPGACELPRGPASRSKTGSNASSSAGARANRSPGMNRTRSL